MKFRPTICLILTVIVTAPFELLAADPLPSWNDGSAKTGIINFIQKTTTPGSADFVPPENRIATFDQDGTLWVEHPVYTILQYCHDRLRTVLAQNPALAKTEPYQSALAGDSVALAVLPVPDLQKILLATLTGMTPEQFQDEAKSWLTTSFHPRYRRPYTALFYQPMREVLTYFRANGYKTFIVTGGDQDFLRVYSSSVYGIPSEQIVGSTASTTFGYDEAGQATLTKSPPVLLWDNFAGKPEGIHLLIGRRPIAAFGNSTGDQQMLEYTRAGKGMRLAMIVLHDDGVREYAYGPAQGLPNTDVGTFTQALYDEATKSGWFVISMKKDWKRIFSFDATVKP